MPRGYGWSLWVLAWVGFFTPVLAQQYYSQAPSPGTPPSVSPYDLLRARLEAQERELQRLRQLIEQNPEVWTTGQSSGLQAQEPKRTDTHEEKFSIKPFGRIQYDVTFGTDQRLRNTTIGRDFVNGQEFRRARIGMQGKGYGIFSYKLEIDFRDPNDLVITDVYMQAQLPIGYLRIGHFKHPMSVEHLQSSKHFSLLERSAASDTIPIRGLGVLLGDTWAGERGTWAIGTFYDDLLQSPAPGDGDADNRDAGFQSLDARVTYLPWYDEATQGRYMMHIGAAMRLVDANGQSVRFRARPEVHDTFRFLGVTTGPASSYQQYVLEWGGNFGPLSFQSDWYLTQVDNASKSFLYGGYFQVSYFLTGEHRSYDRKQATFVRVYPYENFWWVDAAPGCRWGWGAWELAFRWSYLDMNDLGLAPAGGSNGTLGVMHNYTVGVVWYWTPYMRLMFNWVHSNLRDSFLGTTASADMFVTRMHLNW